MESRYDITDTSPEMIAFCAKPKVQAYIRERMGPVQVGMWTTKGSVESWTYDPMRRKQWKTGENHFYTECDESKFIWTPPIFIPNLSQLVRWVPEGWYLSKLGFLSLLPAWTCRLVNSTSNWVTREAPTPEQALLRALVDVAGEKE